MVIGGCALLRNGRIRRKVQRAMPAADELQRQLSGLRITSEAASDDRLWERAHYYGHTGDVPPVGSQWAWARHWIRVAVDGDPFELTNDPEVQRIICFLRTGCNCCRFAPPVADQRPDAQRLPPLSRYEDWGRLAGDSESPRTLF